MFLFPKINNPSKKKSTIFKDRIRYSTKYNEFYTLISYSALPLQAVIKKYV